MSSNKKIDISKKAKPTGYRFKGNHKKLGSRYYQRPENVLSAKEFEKAKHSGLVVYEPRLNKGDLSPRSRYEHGGAIKDQYEGKSIMNVWESWDEIQREHFIYDHKNLIFDNAPAGTKGVYDLARKYSDKSYDQLLETTQGAKILSALEDHVLMGSYKKGGIIESVKSFLCKKVTLADLF